MASAVWFGEMDGSETPLAPGDHLYIPAFMKHWVTFTDPAHPTIWLAIHFDDP